MLTAIVAILAGFLLMWDVLGWSFIQKLKPFETVIGVVALVIGILNILSIEGIALVCAGLVLSITAISQIPKIGGPLQDAGSWLSQFRVVIGIVVLVIGVLGLLGALGAGLSLGGGPPRGVPGRGQ